MTQTRPSDALVAVIHATTAALIPSRSGLAEAFPEAVVWNLLDDRLLTDAAAAGRVDDRLRDRMGRLIRHAQEGGARGILLSCSMYGGVGRSFDRPELPVLGPDDAAFDEVAGANYERVLVVASFESAGRDAVGRLTAHLGRDRVGLDSVVPEGLFAAAEAGDAEQLVETMTAGCRPFATSVDAVLLAQYSLAPAASALSARLSLPVISGPLSAAQRLRARMGYAA